MASCEILTITRTGNGYALTCVERDDDGVPVLRATFPIEIGQYEQPDGLTKVQQSAVDVVWKLLEEHAWRARLALTSEPEPMHKVIADAAKARADLAALQAQLAEAREAIEELKRV